MSTTTEQKKTDEETPAALSRDDVQKMIDGAFKDSLKRSEKLLKDTLATALSDLKKPAEEPAQDGEATQPGKKGGKADDPEYRALLKRVEAAEKKQAEAEAQRKAEAEARRIDNAHAALRKALMAANVRDEALDMLVHAAGPSGLLSYDEEGKPLLRVRRARSKGAAPEEQVFDDLEQGAKDWAQSPAVAAFIKPPANKATAQAVRQTNGGPLQKFTKEAATEDEAVDRVLAIVQGAES